MTRRRRASSVKISESRVQRQLESYPLAERCPDCGKYRYVSRRAAKAARRRVHRSESMSVYRCGDYWHIGHTPRAIRTGEEQRSNLHNEWVRT